MKKMVSAGGAKEAMTEIFDPHRYLSPGEAILVLRNSK
jgi:hypothetical protein